MKHFAILIKPASSLCDMRCKYCFYANVSDLRDIKSYGIMTQATAEALIHNIYQYMETGDSLIIAFQGGEPTLAGLSWFRRFSHIVAQHQEEKPLQLSYSMQTNGLSLTEEFCSYLKEHNYLVGISIDLDRNIHELNRVDAQGKGTYSRINKSKKLLEQYEIDHNILCVLTSPLAKHPQKVWTHILKEKLEFVQFIPCLAELESNAPDKLSLTSQRFADFYSGLLPLWWQAYRNGQYVSIRFFDDLFSLLKYHRVNSCGFTGDCGIQFVIEGDGSVYPCDFYVLDQWNLGNLTTDSVESIQNSPKAQEFLQRVTRLDPLCHDCRFQNFCQGGCPRMAREMYAKDGHCGYYDFLNRNQELIELILQELGTN